MLKLHDRHRACTSCSGNIYLISSSEPKCLMWSLLQHQWLPNRSSHSQLKGLYLIRPNIGHLLAFTRPDIAYVVNRLSQFKHRLTDIHWQAAKRIFRYLAGTISHGLFLRKDSPLSLHTLRRRLGRWRRWLCLDQWLYSLSWYNTHCLVFKETKGSCMVFNRSRI